MHMIAEAFGRALALLMSPSAELADIILRTLRVSGGALVIATAVGVPAGAYVGLHRFPLRGAVMSVLNAFMGLPPVVVGLLLYLALSRSGPLGALGLLYTPWAMTIAQTVLAVPIVAALSASAVTGVDNSVRLAARTLGATPLQESALVIREARFGIIAAVLAAFGRVMAEVGAILIVGGNIRGATRVMTSAIAMETDKGDFTLALALGILLLCISITASTALYMVQRRGRKER